MNESFGGKIYDHNRLNRITSLYHSLGKKSSDCSGITEINPPELDHVPYLDDPKCFSENSL